MLPIIGILTLFALVSCNRREEKSLKEEGSCPKGWQDYSIGGEQEKVSLCHQDGNKDGVYQKDGDKLALKVQDRFVPVEDKDFPSFQQKFRLPNFEGLHVKKWMEVCSSKDRERFLALQNFSRKKNLSMDQVFLVAEKIPWLNEESKLVTWKEIGPEEKLDALSIAGLLIGIQNEQNSFYKANTEFIDTVLNKISEGRLTLQKQTKIELEKTSALTRAWSPERSITYNIKKNVLMLGLPLDLASLASTSSYIHELFHLYQDATKSGFNYLEMEFSAYAKQGEFVIHSMQEPPLQQKYQGVDDYIKKVYPSGGESIESPQTWAIRLAYAQLENQIEQIETSKESLRALINKIYFYQIDLQQFGFDVFKKATQLTNRIIAVSQGNVEATNKLMDAQLQITTQFQKSTLQDLEKSLEKVDPDGKGLDPIEFEELHNKFRQALVASAFLTQLEEYRDRIAAGNVEQIPDVGGVRLEGPRFNKLYQSLAKYQPLKYQPSAMDGVD
jgi:hypothetical protein